MINFGQYVYQPHPLQDWDFGKGFRDLASARRDQQRIDEEKARRQDTNSYNAATFARDRATNEFDTANAKYQQRLKLAQMMEEARQANEQNTVEALGPLLQQAGGTYALHRGGGGPNDVTYEINAGQAPVRPPMDIQGMRQQIYGGAQSPTMGQPFQMPGLGQNPMEPKSVPGLSAASAGLDFFRPSTGMPDAAPTPPQAPPSGAPAAGPPTAGAQPGTTVEQDVANLQTAMDAHDAAKAGQPGGNAPLTGPNPLTPPAFSPWSVSQQDIAARNQLQMKPMLQAIVGMSPDLFRDRASEFTNGISALGMPPAETLKLTQPMFNEAAGMFNAEQAARLAAAKAGQAVDAAQLRREQHVDDREWSQASHNVDSVLKTESMKAAKDMLKEGDAARGYLKEAVNGNRNAAYALVGKLHDMVDKGKMTDADFKQAREGVRTKWSQIKDNLIENFVSDGFNPDKKADILKMIEIAEQTQRKNIVDARDSLWRGYKLARTESARRVYADAIRLNFPEDYWNEEMSKAFGIGGSWDAGDDVPNVGNVPLPSTLDGQPKVSPSGTPLVRGSRVPAKPPAKAPAKPHEQSEDEMLEMLIKAAK